MTDLFWPGSERAGALMSDATFLGAMVAVEQCWLAALTTEGIAPAEARSEELGSLVGPDDLGALAAAAEQAGNPVTGLIDLLRGRLDGEAARWLHRGLTSQDVLDNALMLGLRDVLERLHAEFGTQVGALSRLVEDHRATPMVGRTLTQHAVPITFGIKVGTWLSGLLDAADRVREVRVRLPVQLGGAAGTLAAVTELAWARGLPDPVDVSWRLVEGVAAGLGLAVSVPWHTSRGIVPAAGDALVSCTDAYGRIAADVATLSRPEIGELAEGRGGGSSTMPQKQNPVLSVLIRRAALAGPPLASTLHLAAATTVDERPDGAWHAEWATLRDLSRRTVVATSQASELITGLRVDSARMAANLAASDGVHAEQQTMAALAGGTGGPDDRGAGRDHRGAESDYRGAGDAILDRVLARAEALR